MPVTRMAVIVTARAFGSRTVSESKPAQRLEKSTVTARRKGRLQEDADADVIAVGGSVRSLASVVRLTNLY